MRSLSGTLTTAQKASSRTPYVRLEYLSGGSWIGLTGNLQALKHIQEDYHAGLNAIIQNDDNAHKSLNIRGQQVRVGYGYHTGSGDEYSYAPYLWVEEGGTDTKSGSNTYNLRAIGLWDRLAGSRPGAEVKYNESGNTHNLKAIISDVLTRATGHGLGASVSEDSVVTSRYPKYTLVMDRTYADQLVELLSCCECELIPKEDHLCLIHPLDADPVTYTFDATHVISANTRRIAMFRPNKITIQSIQADQSIVSGSYTDPETGGLAVYEDNKYTTHYWGVTSAAIAEAQAQDMVERAKRRGNKGYAIVKPNCGQELWDVIHLHDQWTGDGFTGRVGRIEVNYRKNDSQGYMMSLGFGAWKQADTFTGGPGQDVSAMSAIPQFSGSMIAPYTIDPWLLRQCMQPYTCTVEPNKTSAAYTWENVVWKAGVINYKDGTKLNLNAGSVNLTAEGYNDTPVILYFTENDSAVHHTSNWAVAMGLGNGVVAVVQRAESSAVKASWDAANGKSGILNTRLLMADMILAHMIKAGQITVDHMASSAVARMWTDQTKRANIEGWLYGATAYLDGADIATGTILLNKMAAFPAHLMDGQMSSFEVWPAGVGNGVAGTPVGWNNETGDRVWYHNESNPQHGKCDVRGQANGETQCLRWNQPIYCSGGDVITIKTWIGRDASGNGDVFFGFKPLDKNGADLGNRVWQYSYTTFTSNVYKEMTMTAVCPTGTHYIMPLVGYYYNATTGNWFFDDVRGIRASQVMVSAADGSKVVIGSDPADGTKFGIFGLDVNNVKQFYMETPGGRAMCGNGAVIFDQYGITINNAGSGSFLSFTNGGSAYGTLYLDGSYAMKLSADGYLYLLAGDYIFLDQRVLFFNGLPSSPAGLPTMAVWCDGSGYLRCALP